MSQTSSQIEIARPEQPPGPRRLRDIPSRVGPYVLLYRLGHGGMSEVHLAEDQQTGKRVAIKHVPAGGDPSHRQRLRREARTTARLEHPSIVQAHDVIDGDEGLWLVMDYVDGTTVYDEVQSGPMPAARALAIAIQIAEGLVAAHRHGVLHRDLKSENVMLTAGDQVRLLDFGLAKALWTEDESQTLTVHGEVMGTCRAMSPEQARGHKLDARSDLFALGSLLYEMVTGASPFQASTPVATMTRVCSYQPSAAHLVEAGVPRQVSSLISRLMAKRREDRPANAQQAVDALRRIAAGLANRRRRPRTALVCSALLIASAVALVLTMQRTDFFRPFLPPGAATVPSSADPATAATTLRLAGEHFSAGDLGTARDLARAVIEGGAEQELTAEACRILAGSDLESGFPDAARRWLDLGAEIAADHGDPELEAIFHTEIGRVESLQQAQTPSFGGGADPTHGASPVVSPIGPSPDQLMRFAASLEIAWRNRRTQQLGELARSAAERGWLRLELTGRLFLAQLVAELKIAELEPTEIEVAKKEVAGIEVAEIEVELEEVEKAAADRGFHQLAQLARELASQ